MLQRISYNKCPDCNHCCEHSAVLVKQETTTVGNGVAIMYYEMCPNCGSRKIRGHYNDCECKELDQPQFLTNIGLLIPDSKYIKKNK